MSNKLEKFLTDRIVEVMTPKPDVEQPPVSEEEAEPPASE